MSSTATQALLAKESQNSFYRYSVVARCIHSSRWALIPCSLFWCVHADLHRKVIVDCRNNWTYKLQENEKVHFNRWAFVFFSISRGCLHQVLDDGPHYFPVLASCGSHSGWRLSETKQKPRCKEPNRRIAFYIPRMNACMWTRDVGMILNRNCSVRIVTHNILHHLWTGQRLSLSAHSYYPDSRSWIVLVVCNG